MSNDNFNSTPSDLFGPSVRIIWPKKKATRAIILIHGLSDTAEWWMRFIKQYENSDSVANKDETMIVLPTAPVRRVSYNGEDQHAWFDVTQLSLEGIHLDKQQAEKTVAFAESLVYQVHEKAGIDYSKIVLGGFSQGASIVVSTFAVLKEKIGLLLFLGGFCPVPEYVKQNATTVNLTTPLLQCHSDDDPIVNYQFALEARDLYASMGFKNWTLKTFTGIGHYFDEIMFDDILRAIGSVVN